MVSTGFCRGFFSQCFDLQIQTDFDSQHVRTWCSWPSFWLRIRPHFRPLPSIQDEEKSSSKWRITVGRSSRPTLRSRPSRSSRASSRASSSRASRSPFPASGRSVTLFHWLAGDHVCIDIKGRSVVWDGGFSVSTRLRGHLDASAFVEDRLARRFSLCFWIRAISPH